MASVIQIVRRFRHGDTGAELIEFALVFPLLALLFAGIIDFGILFQRFEVVTNAAREGARVGILPGYDIPDIQARVGSYFAAAGLTAAYPPPTVLYENVEVTPGGPTMSVVRVNVQYPHQFLFVGPIAVLVGGGPHPDITLTASAQMRREVAAVGP
jgi:Flp pilus assembly protein TadG